MTDFKTQYRYIHFTKREGKPKTSVWACSNSRHGYFLGEVAWYPAWRQYCYIPNEGTEYSIDCLRDIADFCEQLNKKQKGEQKNDNRG